MVPCEYGGVMTTTIMFSSPNCMNLSILIVTVESETLISLDVMWYLLGDMILKVRDMILKVSDMILKVSDRTVWY